MTAGSLRIAVLVKQVPDINAITIDSETRHARIGTERVMNTYDRYALATALDLKDRSGATVSVVTAGPSGARDVLVRGLATGADEAILIDLPDPNGLDTLALARILASELASHSFDLVIAGQSSEDYEAAQVGPQVAEVLGWPHVSLVTQIELQDRRLQVRRDAERAKEVVSLDLPAVLMVLSGRDAEQRHPTLRGMMQARKREIPVVTPGVESRQRLDWSEPVAIEREVTGVMISGQPANEAARQLVAWLRERQLA